MTTTNIGLTQPANGSDIGTWDVPINGNSTLIDSAIGGVTSINVTSASGTIALTSTQYVARILSFTGTLTANVRYNIPSGVGGFWYVENATTGSYTLTFGNAGGGLTIVVTQGQNIFLFSDGTNILPASALLDGTYQYSATAPANDASLKLATTAFVYNASQGSQIAISASTSLTSAQAFPQTILLNGSNITLTFPSTRTIYSLNNNGSATVTLSFRVSSDFKNTLLPGETALLAGDGSGNWHVIACGLADSLSVGYRNIPTSGNSTPAASDVGKNLKVSSGVTIPASTFATDDVFVLINTGGSSISVTPAGGVTLTYAGTTTTGTRTLAPNGIATVLCIGTNSFLISGAGLS